MRFSASSSPLLTICQYPFRPDLDAPEADAGSAARIGTIAWARVAAHVERRPDPGNGEGLTETEIADIEAHYQTGLAWATKRRRAATRCEIMYAWSPSKDEARELPRSDKLRDYYHDASCPPDCTRHCIGDEKPGSVDLVDFDMDGVLVVEDIKTGHTALEQYVPQIRTLGLFAARAAKVRKVRLRLVKLYKDRELDTWEQTLDGFTLDAIAADLRARLEAAATAEPNPGSWCTEMFCKARLVCPAVQAVVSELIPADALVKAPKLSHHFVSVDHDARMLDFLRLVEKWAKDMKDQIKKRTPAEGAVLEDGRVLREGFHDETKWSQEQLISKARELGVKAGLTDEQIDQELDACRYTFKKSEGLKVTKPKALKGRAA